MSTLLTRRTRMAGQQGYALLLVMFLLALLMLTTMTVATNVVTDGQREKEKEMVWRGNQYVRGIKRFYLKMHRFPTGIDDLVKPKTGIRFMRQEYKDPMNTVDGSWRLIYVGPNGQLIGSLRPQTLAPQGTAAPGFGTSLPPSSFGGSSFGGASSGGSTFAGSSFGGGNTSNPTMGSSGLGNRAPNASGQPGANATGTDAMSTPQSIAPGDTPVIMGGNIIGVGSKVDKPSILWYNQAKNYRQFEFIWDPSKDLAMALGGATPAGLGAGSSGGPQSGAPGVTLPGSPNPSPTTPPGAPEGGPPLTAPPNPN